jgi:hypothetical protein
MPLFMHQDTSQPKVQALNQSVCVSNAVIVQHLTVLSASVFFFANSLSVKLSMNDELCDHTAGHVVALARDTSEKVGVREMLAASP